jgi:hypothetical protein
MQEGIRVLSSKPNKHRRAYIAEATERMSIRDNTNINEFAVVHMNFV